MTELYIEDQNGVYQLADTEGSTIAMTYGCNDISKLEDRTANGTFTVRLPQSPNNCLLFDHSQVPDSDSDFPYNRHPCRLYADGYTLAGKGAYLVINEVTDFHFECQILSGIPTFLNLLKEQPMTGLDLGIIIRGQRGIRDNFRSSQYTVPALIVQSENLAQPVIYDNPNLRIPVSFVQNGIDQVCGQNGYILYHNLDQYPEYPDMAINMCSFRAANNPWYAMQLQRTGDILLRADPYPYTFSSFIVLNKIKDNLNILENAGQAEAALGKFTYTSKVRVQVDFTGELLNEYNVGIHILILTKQEGSDKIAIDDYLPKDQGKFTFSKTYDIEVEKNDQFAVELSAYGQNPSEEPFEFYIYNADIQVTVTPTEIEEVPVGGEVNIAENLGFETQFDYLKALLQVFGLTIDVDESKKIVELFTMKKLYDNKPYALDWTGKMNKWNSTQESRLSDYARKNYILFDEADEYTDEGFFEINNRTLARAADLFTIPLESGRDYSAVRFGESTINPALSLANVPLMEQEENDGEISYSFTDGKPHLLLVSQGTLNYGGLTYPVQVVNHYTVQRIVDTFYNELANRMLSRAKVLTAQFLLTPEDIDKYNRMNENTNTTGVFIPVYLHQYGKYFYINQIKNFINGKLTKVELIKM